VPEPVIEPESEPEVAKVRASPSPSGADEADEADEVEPDGVDAEPVRTW
jgi:hypothetical protein